MSCFVGHPVSDKNLDIVPKVTLTTQYTTTIYRERENGLFCWVLFCLQIILNLMRPVSLHILAAKQIHFSGFL